MSSYPTSTFASFMETSLQSHEIEFRQCCHNNNVLGAMRIFNLNQDCMNRDMDISFNNEECFCIVAKHGNLVFIKWLYTTHPIYLINPEKLVIEICEKGHLNILQWMKTVRLIDEVPMKSAYFRAVRRHDILMADWIIDTYPNFNKKEESNDDNDLFAFT